MTSDVEQLLTAGFGSLLEHPALGVVVVGLDGRVLDANRTFRRLLGYTATELPGTPIERFLAGRDAGEVVALFQALVEGRLRFYERIDRLVRKDGRVVWVDIVGSAVRDAEGRVIHAVGLVRDVTEQKRTEEALQQAQKLDAIGRLAGGIAHEFNNLLTTLSGHAEILADEPGLGADGGESVARIRGTVARGAALARQLLAFAQEQPAVSDEVSLDAVVGETAAMLRRVLGEGVPLRLALERGGPRVRADPAWLQQIVLNLVLNARDATRSGGSITVRTGRVPPDATAEGRGPGHGWATLTVEDDGVGMAPDVRARALDPFFTTKAPGEGTGLGLSIVYGIVRRCGGRVELESAPGEGTRVTAFLPALSSGAAAAEGPATARAAGVRVLLVEDQPDVREAVRRLLERSGFVVTAVGDGAEALRVAVKDGRVEAEVVLTDVVMPGLSGPALAERLRRVDPRLPVVFMSGYAREEIWDDADGASGPLLRKPFTGEEVTEVLRVALEGSRR